MLQILEKRFTEAACMAKWPDATADLPRVSALLAPGTPATVCKSLPDLGTWHSHDGFFVHEEVRIAAVLEQVWLSRGQPPGLCGKFPRGLTRPARLFFGSSLPPFAILPTVSPTGFHPDQRRMTFKLV